MADQTSASRPRHSRHAHTARVAVLLPMRAAMEAGVVAGLAYWGYRAGGGTGSRILLALGTPLIGFGLWGAVDFRWAGRLAESLRLVEELGISFAAALAVITAGQPAAGWALAGLSAVYHALVYVLGGRLIEPRRPRPRGRAPADRTQAAGLVVDHRNAGTVAAITCWGLINSGSRPPLAAALRACLAESPDAIRFDLRDSWIDSGGIALLLALYEECLEAGVPVEALTAPATREIFSRLGLPRRFRMEKDGQVVRVIPSGGSRR